MLKAPGCLFSKLQSGALWHFKRQHSKGVTGLPGERRASGRAWSRLSSRWAGAWKMSKSRFDNIAAIENRAEG